MVSTTAKPSGATGREPVKNRLMLPLVVGMTKDDGVLYPDKVLPEHAACGLECLLEERPCRVGVSHICRSARLGASDYLKEGVGDYLLEIHAGIVLNGQFILRLAFI